MTESLDFSMYGATETARMTPIQKFACTALTRSWTNIPHVTHHDNADITALETLRNTLNTQGTEIKLSLAAFLIKAIALTLTRHPKLNASLDASNWQYILKRYYNIGVAIDTPKGLLVGVIRNCDQRGIADIAAELARLSAKARDKGLSIEELSGGSFTVSSLGSIGGTFFTPIINAPEVAILGVGKADWAPSKGARNELTWKFEAPLSLSYDHRIVNGADAARFLRDLGEALSVPEKLV